MRRIVIGLCVAVVLVGCGGGDAGSDSASTDPTPNWKRPNGLVYVTPGLTKKRFMAHLNKYCRRSWPVIKENPASYFASIGFYIYSGIQSFGTAPGERGTVENLLFEMKDGISRGERIGTTDPAAVEAAFVEYNQTAQKLGLDGCAVAGPHIK